jgi:RNA polymerase-binding transcription factor DksA
VIRNRTRKESADMTRHQLTGYRAALEKLAATVEQGLAHDQREVMRMDDPDLPGGPLPSTDDVLDSGTQEVETGLMAVEEGMLGDVKAALARIEAGTFGRCEGCGKGIPGDRLDALPYARFCVRCETAVEKGS